MDRILFFDGTCLMCNGLVEFVLKHDKQHLFKFAPLQGSTAKSLIPHLSNNLSTVVLCDEDGVHIKSDAILRLFTKLGGIWRLAIIFKALPKKLRDYFYELIAHNRYRWFGRRDHCLLPDDKTRSLFLD